ncbi:MAG: rane protein AbrB duplication [Devosia sp.]|uniref:AbrB family transcriptional regulator n=1 Tax=Devosia sp. TaxID=1871048 RepID=UPI002618556F|nr:AbrB family transcriptional regulator [Devosia sp.]MDB5530074.1 rane protein AbrB duplication [Devosia sp.]
MSSLLEPSRRFAIGGRSRPVQGVALLGLSVIFIAILELAGLPAALFLGPMVAGIIIAGADGTVRVPPNLFVLAQGVIGCLMVRALPASVIGEIAKDWPIFAIGVLSVIVAANAIGLVLTRLRVLPGTTAIWGASPGAATAMIIMAEAHGADFRLVALMQYIRVVCVAIAASLVARIWASGGGSGLPPPPVEWFPAIVWVPLLQTLALAFIGAFVGRWLRLPAGSMLLPMILGVVLQNTGIIQIELPQWLLAISYALAGWSIGLRFTRDILGHAARVFPQILASTLLLIAICGLFAVGLVMFAGVDPLTAYLATSPGGADSVAIIAASSKVDVPFVIAMQTARFLVVLMTGPSLARLIVRLAGVSDAPPPKVMDMTPARDPLDT